MTEIAMMNDNAEPPYQGDLPDVDPPLPAKLASAAIDLKTAARRLWKKLVSFFARLFLCSIDAETRSMLDA